MTTKRIRPRSSSTGRKRLSPGSISSNITAGSQKQTSSAANRNPPKPNMRRVPWNGSPSRRNRAEPPSAPSRGKAPSRIHRDRGPTVRSGFLSAESGANSVQVLPVSLLPWPARFSGLDSRRGRCLAETPAERLRFSGGRDSETGSGARTHVAILRTLAFRVGRRDAMGQAARRWHHRRCVNRWSAPMPQPNDLSRSLVALDQDSTIIAVVEMSQSSWLVAGMLPGIERQPCKKLEPNPERLLALLHRWRDEAVKAGRQITRIALAFEAGRDGFWLARWLRAHGVEAHVIHPSSVAVSREHRRAKTDRLDTELLKRGFLGWLRGERGHCTMARIPTIAEEDAKRPNRERECLVRERTRIVNRMKGTFARLGIRAILNQPCARRRSVLQHCTRRRARCCRRMSRPSCSAIWRAWASSSARSRRSRGLVRNDWSRSPRPSHTPWFGCWPGSSVLVSKRLICWSKRCCLDQCVTAERWPATPA